ncbi:MAG TPA: hypothetical protein VL132_12495 [Planctomycetaceae bacterium]|nr:hypothetical protein [Planctomycetaceae bacterium]
MRRRTGWTVAGCLAAGVSATLVGCNDPSIGEYRTYDQIHGSGEQTPAVDKRGALATTQPPAVDELEVAIPASALAPVNVVDGSSVSAVLNVADRGTPTPPADALDPQNAGANRVVQILIPEKEFRTEGAGGTIRVSYDDLDLLKVLNMEPVTPNAVEVMPTWLKELDGRKIRIRGFMYPTFEPTGIEKFVLARDNQICCFGRDPKVYDLIAIEMKSGKTTNYIPNRPFDVAGTFRIEMFEDGGKPLGLYWISDAEIFQK